MKNAPRIGAHVIVESRASYGTRHRHATVILNGRMRGAALVCVRYHDDGSTGETLRACVEYVPRASVQGDVSTHAKNDKTAPAVIGTAWAVVAPNGSLFDVFFHEAEAREHAATVNQQTRSSDYRAQEVALTPTRQPAKRRARRAKA